MESRWCKKVDLLACDRDESCAARVLRMLSFFFEAANRVRARPSPTITGTVATWLLELLFHAFGGSEHEPQITVSVEEIERELYFKHPPGTLSPPDRAQAPAGNPP